MWEWCTVFKHSGLLYLIDVFTSKDILLWFGFTCCHNLLDKSQKFFPCWGLQNKGPQKNVCLDIFPNTPCLLSYLLPELPYKAGRQLLVLWFTQCGHPFFDSECMNCVPSWEAALLEWIIL